MYAGDRVWRNIQENLHGKDRWPALTFGAILTTAVIAVVLTFTYPQKRLYNEPADYSAVSGAAINGSIAKVQNESAPKQGNTTRKPVNQSDLTPMIAPIFYGNNSTDTEKATAETDITAVTNQVKANGQEEIIGNNTVLSGGAADFREFKPSGTVAAAGTDTEQLNNFPGNKTYQSGLPFISAGLVNEGKNEGLSFSGAAKQNTLHNEQEAIAQKGFLNTSMGYGPQKPGKSITRQSRWSVQLYATPSISYRYLLENKTFVLDPVATNGPIAPYLTNPASDFINQKPKLGLEVGTAFLYQLAEKFRVKTGLQVNYRQFGLQAFATSAQPAMLTLNRENGLDSIVRFSSISTQSGYKAIELSSNFLQIAIPVGFDMKIADTRKVDFYVSAAGQFTYQIASSNYLLSADYKNYLKQPDLERKFNINTAVEAFASFEAGGINWQAGPQIRYQLLPGSKSAYPIREHLIDYGFKVGVVKKLR